MEAAFRRPSYPSHPAHGSPQAFGIAQKPVCPEHGPMYPVSPTRTATGVVAYQFACRDHASGCLWEGQATRFTVAVYLVEPI